MADTTTIEISVENWKWLSTLKERPSDSFDDVIDRLRDRYERADVSDDELARGYRERAEDLRDIQNDRESDQDEQQGTLEVATADPDVDMEKANMDAGEALFGDVADDESRELQEETEPVDLPDDLDLPGSGETYKRRRQAIIKLVKHLRREGTATRSDFLELIDADDVRYSSVESFWSNAVKGRNSLSAVDGVESPSEGEHTWRFSRTDS